METKDKKERDEELSAAIHKQRKEKEGKSKLEQDQSEPVIGEEKIDTDGFNSGNENTPDGMAGEGQAAAAVKSDKGGDKENRQDGE